MGVDVRGVVAHLQRPFLHLWTGTSACPGRVRPAGTLGQAIPPSVILRETDGGIVLKGVGILW